MTPQEIQAFQEAHPIFGHLATPAAKSVGVDFSEALQKTFRKAAAAPPQQFSDGENFVYGGITFTIVSSDQELYRIEFPDGTVHDFPKVGFAVETVARNLATADPREFMLQTSRTIKPSRPPWETAPWESITENELLAADSGSLAKNDRRSARVIRTGKIGFVRATHAGCSVIELHSPTGALESIQVLRNDELEAID